MLGPSRGTSRQREQQKSWRDMMGQLVRKTLTGLRVETELSRQMEHWASMVVCMASWSEKRLACSG